MKKIILIFSFLLPVMFLSSCDDEFFHSVKTTVLRNGETFNLADNVTLQWSGNFWCLNLKTVEQGTVTRLDNSHIDIDAGVFPDDIKVGDLADCFSISEKNLKYCNTQRGFLVKTVFDNKYGKPDYYKIVLEPYTVGDVKYMKIYYKSTFHH